MPAFVAPIDIEEADTSSSLNSVSLLIFLTGVCVFVPTALCFPHID
jgi:hypothetical protein